MCQRPSACKAVRPCLVDSQNIMMLATAPAGLVAPSHRSATSDRPFRAPVRRQMSHRCETSCPGYSQLPSFCAHDRRRRLLVRTPPVHAVSRMLHAHQIESLVYSSSCSHGIPRASKDDLMHFFCTDIPVHEVSPGRRQHANTTPGQTVAADLIDTPQKYLP